MPRTIVIGKVLLIDPEDNVLVLRRSHTHPRFAFAPDLPGGEMDENEDIHRAVCREVLEETRLTVNTEDLHLLFVTTEFAHDENRIRHLFALRLATVKPDVTISWEHDEIWWVPLNDLLKKLTHPEYTKGVTYALQHDLIPRAETVVAVHGDHRVQ